MKVPVSSEDKTDSVSSPPTPSRRRSPSAKTAGNSVHSNFLYSRLFIIQLPCVNSRAPPVLGKVELIRKEGFTGCAGLTFRCNKNELAQKIAQACCVASPATPHVRSAHTAAAVEATPMTNAHSFPSRLPFAAMRTLSAG